MEGELAHLEFGIAKHLDTKNFRKNLEITIKKEIYEFPKLSPKGKQLNSKWVQAVGDYK